MSLRLQSLFFCRNPLCIQQEGWSSTYILNMVVKRRFLAWTGNYIFVIQFSDWAIATHKVHAKSKYLNYMTASEICNNYIYALSNFTSLSCNFKLSVTCDLKLFQWLHTRMPSQVISFLQGQVTSSISDCFCLYITSIPLWHAEYELHICMRRSAQNNLSVLPLLSFIFLFESVLSLLSSTNPLVPKFNAICWRLGFQQPTHYFACYCLMTIVVIWFSQNSTTWLQPSFSAKQSISVQWSLVQHRC